MAKRCVYVPNLKGRAWVAPIELEFNWAPGLAPSQKQKNVRSLHEVAASKRGLGRVLEISTKSEIAFGVALSAFNLQLTLASGQRIAVENAFQASKTFERGGPFPDLLTRSAKAAKTDERLRNSGRLVSFALDGVTWPLQPTTAFYDWLYVNALKQNPALADELLEFDAFSDIEFNPDRSLNCQAASAALYVSLVKRRKLEAALASPEDFIEHMVASCSTSNMS